MLDELEDVVKYDTYDTPKDRKRAFLDRLFLGTRFYFLIRYGFIILYLSNLAKKDKYHHEEFKLHGKLCFKLLEDCGAKFHIEGLDNLRKVKNEPVVIVANHMSTLETMILPLLVLPIKDIIFVAKESLLTFPVFGHVMKATKPITVGRTNPREDLKAVLDEGQKVLKTGTSIVIFQQSHRDPVFGPEKFGSLGIKLALKGKVRIVPLALKTDFWGNAKYIRDLGPIRRHEKVCFSFGEPIEIEGNGKETNEKVVQFIQKKLEEWNHNPVPEKK